MYSFATSFILLVLFVRFIYPCCSMLLSLICPLHTFMDAVVWLVDSLFICPHADGHLDCCKAFALTNNVAVNLFYISHCENYQEVL